MRKLIFLFLLCITYMLQAQNVIDNPKFKYRSGSIYTITGIKLCTQVRRSEIIRELPVGIYIVGREKIAIMK